MNLNKAESHLKIITFLKDFYNKGWSDGKMKVLVNYAKQYDLNKFKKIISEIVENEITLPPNPIPLIENKLKPELDKKDAERVIAQIEGKLNYYKCPIGDLTELEKTLISDFGGWLKTCDYFDEFKWFVRNAVKSGIDVSGRYSKNALEGYHDRNNKRLKNKNRDAKVLKKILDKNKELEGK